MFGIFKSTSSTTRESSDDVTPIVQANAETKIVEATLPILREEVDIAKRRVEGDTISVETQTRTTTETVESDLFRDAVDVSRVPVNRTVDELPTTKKKGDTTIIPVVKERLVVRKELVLVEEIHITHERQHSRVSRDIELREQVADIRRTSPD